MIFANQRKLDAETFIGYAQQLGLDEAKFKADFAAAEVKKRVDADAAEAAKLGVTGTPGFFVNGRFLRGAKPFEDFKKLIDEENKAKPLSDQALVTVLAKEQGIKIARRTVAKYREMLGILASSKRKVLF